MDKSVKSDHSQVFAHECVVSGSHSIATKCNAWNAILIVTQERYQTPARKVPTSARETTL